MLFWKGILHTAYLWGAICNGHISGNNVEFLDKWLMIYVDNFLLSTNTKTEHLVALEQLFQRLRKLNIKCRKEKCQFMVDTIRTMGFEVKKGEIRPDSHKIDMLRRTMIPKTKAALKAYLGLLQFYRNMLPHLTHCTPSLFCNFRQLFIPVDKNFTADI